MTDAAYEAWVKDEADRFKKIIHRDELRQKIVEKKEQVEWSREELYPRQLKYVPLKKKPFNLLCLIKSYLP